MITDLENAKITRIDFELDDRDTSKQTRITKDISHLLPDESYLVMKTENIKKFFEIEIEIEKAKKFPPFASLHEGYAVLKEEVEEFWDSVKSYKYCNDFKENEIQDAQLELLSHSEKELIQIAAMAVKNLQLVDSMRAKIKGKIL